MRPQGIIEVNRYNDRWEMVALLNKILPRSISLMRYFSYSDMDYHESVFADRGVPDNVCYQGARMYDEIHENAKYETHFTHEELCNKEISLRVNIDSNRILSRCPLLHIREAYETHSIGDAERDDMDLLFQISSDMAKTYGPENVRWVMWFK